MGFQGRSDPGDPVRIIGFERGFRGARKGFFLASLFWVLGSAGAFSADSEPSVENSPAPSRQSSPALSVSPEKLLVEYRRSQTSQRLSLEHRQELEIRELKTSQAARKKEWDVNENLVKEIFLSKKPTANEKAAYFTDLKERSRLFQELLERELKDRQEFNRTRRENLRQRQNDALTQFQEYLKRGENPPQDLWPDFRN